MQSQRKRYQRHYNREQWAPFAIVLDPVDVVEVKIPPGCTAGIFYATVAERTTDSIRRLMALQPRRIG